MCVRVRVRVRLCVRLRACAVNSTWYCFGCGCQPNLDVVQAHAQHFFNDAAAMCEFHAADNGTRLPISDKESNSVILYYDHHLRKRT